MWKCTTLCDKTAGSFASNSKKLCVKQQYNARQDKNKSKIPKRVRFDTKSPDNFIFFNVTLEVVHRTVGHVENQRPDSNRWYSVLESNLGDLHCMWFD